MLSDEQGWNLEITAALHLPIQMGFHSDRDVKRDGYLTCCDNNVIWRHREYNTKEGGELLM